ncbi:MAG: HAD family hydrolase [Clostridia bacterium]|nr:HAD family hydrolase [Clostridia bacterium]
MTPVRLIATDIDGTLLDGSGVIPPENIDAIRAAQAKGITVAIASGRFAENVYLLLRDYGLSCFIIGGNGADITDEGLKPVRFQTMKQASALAVKRVLDDHGADYFFYGEHWLCTSADSFLHHTELSHPGQAQQLGFSYYHGQRDAGERVLHPVYKFYICANVPLPPIRQDLAGIPDIDITRSGPGNIEVMPQGVNKAQGVRDLAAHLGIPLSQVMTLGDEENDIPMLKIAGYGVAMGNGSAAARAAARIVTDSNCRGGFAKAIRQYALQEG